MFSTQLLAKLHHVREGGGIMSIFKNFDSENLTIFAGNTQNFIMHFSA